MIRSASIISSHELGEFGIHNAVEEIQYQSGILNENAELEVQTEWIARGYKVLKRTSIFDS